ncbi:MAG TPA: ParB N-terminal domain-containing protein [Nitrosopumilaceae archaeon]|nr:ParB N-terminal domain-containing protein [Nitrosopumilaceae archaeon]
MIQAKYSFEFISISKIKKGNRIRQDYGDIESFARSIESLGFLIYPIAVTADYLLLDGGRRLAAVEFLGWKVVPVIVVNPEIGETRNEE